MQATRQRSYRYWLVAGAIATALLVSYGLAEALHLPFVNDVAFIQYANPLTALMTIGLLTADTLLPIPSSIIMVANGALFGFMVGSLVSLIGNVGGFLFAYWLGQQSSQLLHRTLTPHEMSRGNQTLQQWGVLALILTRPLPILAETTAIMAGVSRLPFTKSLLAVIAGSAPISLAYAWAGSHAHSFHATALIFLALMLLAGIAWKVDRAVQKKQG